MTASKFMLFALLVSLFFACQKDDDVNPGTPPPSGIPKVKTVFETPDTLETNYAYDAQGRVTEVNYSNGWIEKYIYGPSVVTVENYNGSGILQNIDVFTLNSSGLCTSATFGNYTNTYGYEYNDAHRFSHTTITAADGFHSRDSYYYYEGGNLVKDSSYLYGSDGWIVYTYEYYQDVPSTLGYQNFGIFYWGEGNKNFYKKRTRIDSNGNIQVDTFGYPTLNDEGQITRKTVTINGSSTYVEEFSYFD